VAANVLQIGCLREKTPTAGAMLPPIDAPEPIIIKVDGSYFGGKTKTGGIAVIIKQGEKILRSYGQPVPEEWMLSNNIGPECLAFLRGLQEVNAYPTVPVTICSDCDLVVAWYNGTKRSKTEVGNKFLEAIKRLEKEMRRTATLEAIWIPREQNTECDELAKKSH